ncbi:MAG: RBBP9/YdeN family alpha/beta hydrolase [Janthinobacterium lividum]
MRSRDTDLLIIPGLGGSGPDHWQTRWAAKLPNPVRVEQEDWDHPVAAAWEDLVVAAVESCERPVVAIAHSLGVVTLVRAAPRVAATGKFVGAFMVAPPSETTLIGIPEIDGGFRPYPTDPLPFRSLLVGSHDDPYAEIEETATLSAAWGSVFVDAGNAGHINAASGHGPWPEGLMTFAGFLSRL